MQIKPFQPRRAIRTHRAVEARDDAENERLWAEYDARREWIADRTEVLIAIVEEQFADDDMSPEQIRELAHDRATAEAARGAWMKRDED